MSTGRCSVTAEHRRVKYLRVGWKHQNPDDPVMLYSELNAERWEVRKVEVFRNGRCGYASPEESSGGTELGKVPVPALTEIVKDPQFEPSEISREEFEAVWARRQA
jgi:hypothetical protein